MIQEAAKKLEQKATQCYRKPTYKNGKIIDMWKVEISKYAWRLNQDKDMLATFVGEGDFNPNRKSDMKYWCPKEANSKYRNTWQYDYGGCQISRCYHPEIVDDLRFSDPKWQMEQCVRLYKGGTTFYGYQARKANMKYIICE